MRVWSAERSVVRGVTRDLGYELCLSHDKRRFLIRGVGARCVFVRFGYKLVRSTVGLAV